MTPEHRQRTALLDAMAQLAGFNERLRQFPDGREPDVLRLSLRDAALFVGDAKAAERSSSVDTYLQLRRYMCWVAAFDQRRRRHAVVALAVPTVDAAGWAQVVLALAGDTALGMSWFAETTFDGTTVLTMGSDSDVAPAAAQTPATPDR